MPPGHQYYMIFVERILIKTCLFNAWFLKSLTCRIAADHFTVDDINQLTKLERLEVRFLHGGRLCLLNLEILRFVADTFGIDTRVFKNVQHLQIIRQNSRLVESLKRAGWRFFTASIM